MRTIVTDATPDDLAKLAGVVWEKAAPTSRVRWGWWGKVRVGIEVLRKLYAVHVGADLEKLVGCLAERRVFGSEAWTAATGEGVPCIGGEPVADLIEGFPGVSVAKDGKKSELNAEAAKSAIEVSRVA